MINFTLTSTVCNALGVLKNKTIQIFDTHLKTAENYSLLGTAITNTGISSCNLNCGQNAAAVAGEIFSIGGISNFANTASTQAMFDASVASVYYKTQPIVGVMTGDITGQVFTPGAWFGAAAVTNSDTIYFDAQGIPDAVFILNFGAAFAPAAFAKNVLLNGAKSSRIFITAVGAISTGASSNTMGTVMCDAAITLGIGSSITGRVLAHTAALTMASNIITTI